MKKIAISLLVVILGLMGIISVRALSIKVTLPETEAYTPIPVEPDVIAERLSRALQFQTISNFDRNAFNDDAFQSLHNYLEQTYPLTHRALRKEVVNGNSLVYTWKGSDENALPVLMMGHQDVVPVDPQTEKLWSHPAFEGRIADGFIWGRGALDDKINVIGIMEAAERLLKTGFVPARTIYFAFGHDEEANGNGAAAIASLFEARKIRFDSVMDEGSVIFGEEFAGVAAPKALIGIAEKGFLNLELSVESKGGHSSMPPRETAVGILSAAIVKLQDNPLPAKLDSPAGQMMQALAPHMPFGNRLVFRNLWLFKPMVIYAMSKEPSTNAQIRTTTAPTMLQGSPKDNVLAAKAFAVINFRIIPGDTVQSVTEFVKSIVADQRVQIKTMQNNNPSPVSDFSGKQFEILSKTVRQTFPEAIPVPALVSGATDSRYFTRLTRNIFRFTPVMLRKDDLDRVHGTNERVSIDAFAKTVQFYALYISNVAK